MLSGEIALESNDYYYQYALHIKIIGIKKSLLRRIWLITVKTVGLWTGNN